MGKVKPCVCHGISHDDLKPKIECYWNQQYSSKKTCELYEKELAVLKTQSREFEMKPDTLLLINTI